MNASITRIGRPSAEQVLRRLDWQVVRRLDGLLQGDYRSLFRGFGLDLADLREYQLHDDVRHIDWNVTARLQVPHVRQYHEDREISAWFLVDHSPSIDFGSREVAKRTVAAEFVAVLARVLTRHGNRVGAIVYGDGVGGMLPARAGRAHVLQLLHRMLAPPAQRQPGGTDLAELFRMAHNVVTRRSLVFVVSDFISAPGWDRALGFLTRRHDVVAVRLFDPLEQELPDLGLVTVEDAETGEQVLVDTGDPAFRRRFVHAAEQREEALRESFAKAGVDVLELSTNEDLVDAVFRFAALRKGRFGVGADAALPEHLEGRVSSS